LTVYCPSQQELAERISTSQVSISNWQDWRWQLKNSVRDIASVETSLSIRFAPDERKQVELTLEKFPLAITPYYLSLIDSEDFRNDPVFMQAFPSPRELDVERDEMMDPLAEDKDSPGPGITHRYPDRVLLQVSNVCSMYCRHCTRSPLYPQTKGRRCRLDSRQKRSVAGYRIYSENSGSPRRAAFRR